MRDSGCVWCVVAPVLAARISRKQAFKQEGGGSRFHRLGLCPTPLAFHGLELKSSSAIQAVIIRTYREACREKARRLYPHTIVPVLRHQEDCLHAAAMNRFLGYPCTCGKPVKVGYALVLG